MYVVVSKHHPLAKQEKIKLEEALRYPLILETPGCDSDIQELLEQASVVPNICYSFRDDSIILSFVEQGLGVTISQELVLKAFGNDVIARPLDPAERRIIGLSFADTMNSLLSDVFLEYMRNREQEVY